MTRAKKSQEKQVKEKVIAAENRTRSPLRLASEPKTPITPPERIYRELGNFTSRKESTLHLSKPTGHYRSSTPEGSPHRPPNEQQRRSKTPNVETVIDMIKKWRLNEGTTPEQTEILEQTSHSSKPNKELRKDNVAPDEVVKIINEHRQMKKIEYVQYNSKSGSKSNLTDKLDELQSIFEQLDSAMEWEKINTQAVSDISDSISHKELIAMANGSPSEQNFFKIG
ncbi:unnamed protein product [Rhizophagus irregularis]|nr:unnamed protein product [Rhizophagus irregularis]